MSAPSSAHYDPRVAALLQNTFGDYMTKPTIVGECSCSYALNVFLGLMLFNVMIYLSYVVGKKEIFQKLKYHGYY
ncbi:hypothetical protein C922_04998 [Plasmodium inui San Antonio 1]|uniref:Uncharacterized protein n=1 Tax=Plasmodium inui San Antonio 1 TaxID=1237626 RepID=W7AHB2_9APIC|nr:hypothetical protein C922_04998 [Plasmodium inui San Antonio 1]EUD64651.1 hypothetical protein C922_04998 [Plasmodium inui San Antonio 1]